MAGPAVASDACLQATLFAERHRVQQSTGRANGDAAAFIDGKVGSNQVRKAFSDPAGAPTAARLFVSRGQPDKLTLEMDSGAAQNDQRHAVSGNIRLIVIGASAIDASTIDRS